MAEQARRHHIIPECYQRGFTNKAGQIAIYRDGNLFMTNPKNVLVEKDYYRVSKGSRGPHDNCESLLASVEGWFARIMRERIKQGQPLTNGDRADLAFFLATMFLRIKNTRHSYLSFGTELFKVISAMEDFISKNPEAARQVYVHPNKGAQVSTDEIRDFFASQSDAHAQLILDHVPTVAKLFQDFAWSFLVAENGSEFITGDHPLAVFNLERVAAKGLCELFSFPGLANANATVVLPLNKHICFFANHDDSSQYSRANASASIVLQINQIVRVHSSTLLGSSTPLLQQVIDSLAPLEPSTQ